MMTVKQLISELEKVEHKEVSVEVRLPYTEGYDKYATVSELFHGVLEGGGYIVSLDVNENGQ